MAYAILRTQKIKTWTQAKASSGHMARSRQTDNANPDIANEVIIGSGNPYHDLNQRIEQSGAHYRKNSVKAIDVLLTASPEYFKSDKDITDFTNHALTWAQQYFGKENLVSAILHLDETTPHITCMVAPVDETERKKGPNVRLNAKKWLGGKAKLSKMQDSYAKVMQNIDLKRGIKGSKAKHTTIKQYYSAINEKNVINTDNIKVNIPPKIFTKKQAIAYAEEETENIQRKIKRPMQTLQHQANSSKIHKRKKIEYEKTAKTKEKKERELKNKVKELEKERKNYIITLQKNEKMQHIFDLLNIKMEDNAMFDVKNMSERDLYIIRKRIEEEFNSVDENDLQSSYYQNLAEEYESIENAIENKLELDVDIDAWCSSREKKDDGPEL